MTTKGFFYDDLAIVTKDDRRTIREATLANGQRVSILDIHAKIPLGNHAHEKTEETFLLTRGKGTFFSCPLNSEEITQQEISIGSLLHIPTGLVHTFLLEPNSQLVCFSDDPFDENDLIRHKLI